jgi:membrane-associated phospholipid phosphatase
MRKQTTTLLCLWALVWIATACKETPVELEVLPVLNPTQADANGGTWKMVLFENPASLSLPTPEIDASAAYRAEVNQVKAISASLTPAQRAEVTHWGAGAVLRWNEIARDLVTQYNVPPVFGAAPDPTSPFAQPVFAARVYALLSVAQYDALVATWYFKQQHNRKRPYELDPAVTQHLPSDGLPGYPSEAAVVAEVSREILAFLFPREALFLEKTAATHKHTQLLAGKHVQSDIRAGELLARQVAERVLAHARSDRASRAPDPEQTWRNIQVDMPWVSLERPARPPLAPLFGQVKTWFDSTAIFQTLPGPPPAVGSPEFEADLADVARIARTRTREQWRISAYWADGAGTYTPPGHWNKIAADLAIKNSLNELRTARMFALMNRAVMDVGVTCWYLKYKYFLPRPSQIEPSLSSSTGIPNFPAYTSGHSSFSAAAATVLGFIFPAEAAKLMEMAEEAGMSRIYGGIHYHFDNTEGRKNGIDVGNVAISWALQDGA